MSAAPESDIEPRREEAEEWMHDDVVELLAAYVDKLAVEKKNNLVAKIMKEALGNVEEKLKELHIKRPKKLSQKVRNYLQVKNPIPPRSLWKQRELNFNDVFNKLHGAKCDEETTRLSGGAQPGTKEWIAHYQKARGIVRARLDDEEMEHANEVLEHWKKTGLPEDVQASRRSKYMKGDVEKFAHFMKSQYGASVGMVVMWKEDGEPHIWRHATKPVYANTPFWEHSRNWQKEGFSQWAEEEFLDEDEITERQANGTSQELEHDRQGHCLLPKGVGTPKSKLKHKDQRNLIRAVIKEAWTFREGRPSARPPYKEMREDAAKFVEDKYFPIGWVWKDPEHLLVTECAKLLQHWRKRQDNKEPILVFRGAETRIPRAQPSKKPAYVEVDDGLEAQDEVEVEKKTRGGKQLSNPKASGSRKRYVKSDNEEEGMSEGTSEESEASQPFKWPRTDSEPDLPQEEDSSDTPNPPPANTKGKGRLAPSKKGSAPNVMLAPESRRKRGAADPEDKRSSGSETAEPGKMHPSKRRKIKRTEGLDTAPKPKSKPKPRAVAKAADRAVEKTTYKMPPVGTQSTMDFLAIAHVIFGNAKVPDLIAKLSKVLDSVKSCMWYDTGLPRPPFTKAKAKELEDAPATVLPEWFHKGSKDLRKFLAWLDGKPYATDAPDFYLVNDEDFKFLLTVVSRMYRDTCYAVEAEDESLDVYRHSKLSHADLDLLTSSIHIMMDTLSVDMYLV